MRKLLLTVALALCVTASFGQSAGRSASKASKAPVPEVVEYTPEDFVTDYNQLLSRESQLLQRRKEALGITLSGALFCGVGGVITATGTGKGNNQMSAGNIMMIIGGSIAGVGAIWAFVNEINLCNARIQINDRTQLAVGPTGLTLTF